MAITKANRNGHKSDRKKTGKPPGEVRRTDDEHERDLEIIAGMKFRGLRVWQMADELNQRPAVAYRLSREMVQKDVEELRKRWREAQLIDTHEERMRTLDEIEELKAMALRDYARALEEHESTASETIEADAPPPAGDKKQPASKTVSTGRMKVTVKTEPGAADSGLLRVVAWCIDKRVAITGIAAPVKIAPTNPDGSKEYQPNADMDVTERARRLAGIFQSARRRQEQGTKPEDANGGPKPTAKAKQRR